MGDHLLIFLRKYWNSVSLVGLMVLNTRGLSEYLSLCPKWQSFHHFTRRNIPIFLKVKRKTTKRIAMQHALFLQKLKFRSKIGDYKAHRHLSPGYLPWDEENSWIPVFCQLRKLGIKECIQ